MKEVHVLTLTVCLIRDVENTKDYFTANDVYENVRDTICEGLTDEHTVVSCDYVSGSVSVV